jgi:hypothetical protein
MYSRGLGAVNSFAFNKVSGPTPYPNFQVGDAWTIQITGAANSPIFVASIQNGVPQPVSQFGTTDASGVFSFSGTMLDQAVGSWSESWYIGGAIAGGTVAGGTLLSTVNFMVSPAQPASSSGPAASAPPAPANPSYANPAQVNQVLNTSGLQIAGYDVPWWAVAGVAAGLLFMFSGGRHR